MTDRKHHWEGKYNSLGGPHASWHQEVPGQSLAMIDRAGLSPDSPVIDVGGGDSRLVDFLLQKGFRDITVLDISAVALSKAKKRLGKKAHQVKWVAQDITDFKPDRIYALWHDRAMYHFLCQECDRDKYRTALGKALEPGGQLVISGFAIGGPEKCSGLDIIQYDGANLAKELGGEFRLLEEMQEVHVTPANREQLFGFYRFARR